jgi:hypothetical protein
MGRGDTKIRTCSNWARSCGFAIISERFLRIITHNEIAELDQGPDVRRIDRQRSRKGVTAGLMIAKLAVAIGQLKKYLRVAWSELGGALKGHERGLSLSAPRQRVGKIEVSCRALWIVRQYALND